MAELDVVIADALQLFTELAAIQEKAMAELAIPSLSLTDEELCQHLQQGIPLLHFLPVIDPSLAVKMREPICDLLGKLRPDSKPLVDQVNSYLAGHGEIYQEFLKVGRNLNLIEETMVADVRELLELIVFQSTRPLLQKYAVPMSSLVRSETEQWQRNYCPVCGEKATVSYLRKEDGKRVLVCPLCGTEWVYRYLGCSWCGSDDHNSYSFIQVEGFPAYEVYICEHCHGYLKTYNGKKGLEHEDWMIEDIKTIPLDLLAAREGYGHPVFQS